MEDDDHPVLTRRAEVASLEQQANSHLPPLPPDLEERWVQIAVSESWSSTALITRPKPLVPPSYLDSPRISTSQTRPRRPLIVLFHGGGFTTGSPLMLTLPARSFAQRFNATVICPSYRLAPEHPWPLAMMDGLEIVKLLSEKQEFWYGADPAAYGFILGGFSAGAGIAAVVAGCVSWDAGKYALKNPLTGVFLSIPILFTEEIVPAEHKRIWKSREENRDGTPLSTSMVEEILEMMRCTDYKSPLFSPVNLLSNGSRAQTTGTHPQTYLQACDLDPLRDDAIVYEKTLASAGVQTKIHVFPDDGHNALTTFHAMFGSQSKSPTIWEGTLEGLHWLLDQRSPIPVR